VLSGGGDLHLFFGQRLSDHEGCMNADQDPDLGQSPSRVEGYVTPVMEVSPKKEMIARLLRIVEVLEEDPRYREDAKQLAGVIRSLKQLGKDATIHEVVIKTFATVVRHDVTLGGRLVDVLGHLAVQYGVPLSMHPLLLIVAALGGRDNPDRQLEGGSVRLDALLGIILDEPAEYQHALYTIATLARQYGLDATADMAVELLEELNEHGANTAAEQAKVIQETKLVPRPTPEPNDDLGWVIKLMLTLGSLAALIAVAGKLTGGLRDLIDGLDGILDVVGGSE
jgi:hypothetical protein